MNSVCWRLYVFAAGLIILSFLIFGCTPQVRYSRPTKIPPSKVSQEKPISDTAKKTLSSAGTVSESRLHQIVDSYIGVPYRWGGTTRKGFDCSGFVRAVYRDLTNTTLPRTSHDMSKMGTLISKNQLKAGDLVFFRNGISRKINHVGIYVGNGRFAHASSKRGVTYSTLGSSFFSRKYVLARRLY